MYKFRASLARQLGALKDILTEVMPLSLTLNKQHLFSRTQHRFILINFEPLHVC